MCILPGMAAPSMAADKDAILILDASGSMWGQIDGINKIVIARDVVEGLVRGLPAGRRLGLVAYGHRREGDCGDIETLAGVGAARADVIERLRAVSPKGKTPLGKSVEHAANTLDYQKHAADIILVSDGLENCGVDPCALARTLEENGIDLTIHVVGFDVTEEERAGLSCIAGETGGLFLAADDADALGEALEQVAIAPPPEPEPEPEPETVVVETEPEPEVVAPEPAPAPLPSEVVLKATILRGGPLIQSDLDWSVTDANGDTVFSAGNGGSAETQLPPGNYRVEALWRGWREGGEKTGALDLSIGPRRVEVVTVPVDLGLPVTLDAAGTTPEGQPLAVTWTGPDALGTTISVTRPDNAPLTEIFFFPTARTRGDVPETEPATAEILIPPQAGDYEIRYTLRRPPLILARRPLTVTDAPYSVSGPADAPISTEIEVGWEGTFTPGDIVTLVPEGYATAFDNKRYRAIRGKKALTLTTPPEPGAYELRYVMTSGYTTYPGMHHVVQASTPITITAVTATLDAPVQATGGSTINVAWTGPDEGWQDDVISVVTPGETRPNRKSNTRVSKRGEALQPLPVRVPDTPGDYEIVYFVQPGPKPLARIPLTIVAATASVSAPDTVRVGEDFEVTYSGEAFRGDRVVFAQADTPDAKMWGYSGNYGFIVKPGESSGTVRGKVVARPGAYEVRYVTGLEHRVLARDSVTVTE